MPTTYPSAAAIKRRKILWSCWQAQKNSGHDVATIRGPGMPMGFAADTAASIGIRRCLAGWE
ncbi:MAG: hypothetical protein KAX46_04190 [Chromatiaceae bacterium]|nr:hypothetical protein [Chromatiaceae bacterium]